MKKQKKDKRRQSTQQLMGIQKITDYCISTDAGDLVFYIIKPTNISVLPAGAGSGAPASPGCASSPADRPGGPPGPAGTTRQGPSEIGRAHV